MARTEHGEIPEDGQRQPGGTLVYDYSGLIEGTIRYVFDEDHRDRAISKIGLSHPDDPDVQFFSARITQNTNGLLIVDYDCIGIDTARGSTTTPVVTLPNSVSTDPIETHPHFRQGISQSYDPTKFPAPLAGWGDVNSVNSVGNGLSQKEGLGVVLSTGAQFNMGPRDTNGKRKEISFLGFTGPDAPDDLRYVRAYYVANVMAVVSYYTNQTPVLKEPTTIQDPQNVTLPSIISNTSNPALGLRWMHLVSSAEQVGKVNIWKVVEQYISGKNISDKIYNRGGQLPATSA